MAEQGEGAAAEDKRRKRDKEDGKRKGELERS